MKLADKIIAAAVKHKLIKKWTNPRSGTDFILNSEGTDDITDDFECFVDAVVKIKGEKITLKIIADGSSVVPSKAQESRTE